MGQSLVDKDSALLEFERIADFYHLADEFDESDMDQESLDDFKNHRKRLVNSIMKGNLFLNPDKGIELKLISSNKLENVESIIFRDLDGAALLNADKAKKNSQVAQIFYMLSSCTGIPPAQINKLAGIDLKIALSISALFYRG